MCRRKAEKRRARKAQGKRGDGSSSSDDDSEDFTQQQQAAGKGKQGKAAAAGAPGDADDPFNDPFFQVRGALRRQPAVWMIGRRGWSSMRCGSQQNPHQAPQPCLHQVVHLLRGSLCTLRSDS